MVRLSDVPEMIVKMPFSDREKLELLVDFNNSLAFSYLPWPRLGLIINKARLLALFESKRAGKQ